MRPGCAWTERARTKVQMVATLWTLTPVFQNELLPSGGGKSLTGVG